MYPEWLKPGQTVKATETVETVTKMRVGGLRIPCPILGVVNPSPSTLNMILSGYFPVLQRQFPAPEGSSSTQKLGHLSADSLQTENCHGKETPKWQPSQPTTYLTIFSLFYRFFSPDFPSSGSKTIGVSLRQNVVPKNLGETSGEHKWNTFPSTTGLD